MHLNYCSGTLVHELVCGLMIWVWFKVDSIGMFACESWEPYSALFHGEYADVKKALC